MRKLIRVVRHSKYLVGFPKNWDIPTFREMAFGHLTEEGEEMARAMHKAWLTANLSPSSANILIRYSPTFWLDNPKLGQRAKESAIVLEEVAKSLNFEVVARQLDQRLGEAQFVQTGFLPFLRENSGGKQGPEFWHNWESDKFSGEREAFGAEGPADVSARAMLAVNNAVSYLNAQPDDVNNVVIMITHAEVTVPIGQHFGVEVAGGYNQGITLKLVKGKLEVIETE